MERSGMRDSFPGLRFASSGLRLLRLLACVLAFAGLVGLPGTSGMAAPDALRLAAATTKGRLVWMKRVHNKYFKAEPYKSFVGTSYAKCAELCLKERQCVALDFEKGRDQCQLFDRVGETEPNNASDLAIKETIVNR
jgi:PAN domain-containing protein